MNDLLEMWSRIKSRKFAIGTAGLVFYALGVTDQIEMTEEQSLGGLALAGVSVVTIAIVDAIKAWRGGGD
jgi:hypothetical protein